jgi:hypothetical protein
MNHYIVKCHGINLSTNRFEVPEDTCIITVTATGVSLKDLIVKMSRLSVSILAKNPPVELFERGNTSKVKTDECGRYETYLRRHIEPKIDEDGEIIKEGEVGDPNIIFRNHLPGDVLPDIYLSTDEPNPERKKFFGIHTKIPGNAIQIENREIHMNLTALLQEKKGGVYILFVCRTDEGLHMFKSKFKTDPEFREFVNLYLSIRQQGRNADEFLDAIHPSVSPILQDLGDKGIPDVLQAMSYLNDTPPPPLALSRKHSQTTDENEEEVEKIMKTLIEKRAVKLTALQNEIDRLTSEEFRKGKSKETIQYIDENIDEKISELREEMRKIEMKRLPPISTIRRDTHYPEIDGGKTKRKRRKQRRKSNKYKRR